jgi:hypothetical protein
MSESRADWQNASMNSATGRIPSNDDGRVRDDWSDSRRSWYLAFFRIAEGREILASRLEQETDEGRRRLQFDLLGQERCI